MGVRSVLGIQPLRAAQDARQDAKERVRRAEAQRRVDLYLDNAEPHLRAEIWRIFKAPEVRLRLEPFLKMAACEALFKRVVDEIARPVYSTPPRRTVRGTAQDVEAYGRLARQCKLNERMDLAVRLAIACNQVFLYYRVTERHGLILDVLTPNQVTVIPDPEDPLCELALIYDTKSYVNGRETTLHVYWDDEETFRYDDDGHIVPWAGDIVRTHGLGTMPFVPIRRREHWGSYWDSSTGSDLEEAQIAIALLTALTLKLHKAQGEKQVVIVGDLGGMIKDQTLDGEGALIAPEGTVINTLDLHTDPGHYLKTIADITIRVAANHGMSVSRLNQIKSGQSNLDEIGLLERRADLIKRFWTAEQDAFEKLKIVSREHSEWRLSDEAELFVDFGEIEARTDRLTQLKIREEEERMGLRNRLDDIIEDQPELEGNEEAAKAEYLRNLELRAWRIEQERALNMPQDPDNVGAGQTPEDNGAMGPAVRDGDMTAGEARDMARDMEM